jgi:hypothetical protein
MSLPSARAPALYPIAATYHRPATLVLPERPPKLVYLDLNHWISLAKANAGHRDGDRFRDALAACEDALARGVAVFPLADAIYMEVSRIASHRQRSELAAVMERVSRFTVITSRSIIADHEVEALLDRLVGPSTDPIDRMHYLDWGVARAFGKVEGFRVYDESSGEDITERIRAEHPMGPDWFDAKLREGELQMNRKVIEGPSGPDDIASLRQNGYDPYAAHRTAVQRAQQEIDQAHRLAAEPEWRQGRTRDVIAAREVLIELSDKLMRGLVARSAKREAVFADEAAMRRALSELPSFDVAITMKTSYHRDGTRTWTPNDINDIDMMGSTLPFCDIVVTDKAVANHAIRTSLPERCGSSVLAGLDDLMPLL